MKTVDYLARNQNNKIKKVKQLLEKNAHVSSKYFKSIIKVPERLDFVNNNTETMNFFNEITLKMNIIYKSSQIFIINLENVKYIEPQTLVYFIAFIELLKHNLIRFRGNLPISEEVKIMLGHYGIQNFVFTKQKLSKSINTIAVNAGTKVDQKIAANLCDYVEKNFGLSKDKINVLYSTIIELMDNTFNHAYESVEGKVDYPQKWYICINNSLDYIEIIFMDIGLGIPNTIYKKVQEDIFNKRHSDLIESTLKGDTMRTSTRDTFRGYGLKETFKNFSERKMFEDLEIISGKGVCLFNDIDRNIARKIELDVGVNGTIIKWKLFKEVKKWS